MKKLLAITFIIAFSLVAFAHPTFAQTNMCNQRCDVDSDCGTGYRCYVGVCRLDLCPASSSCSCGTTVTATPTATPKASSSPTATPRPSATPQPTATARPTSTPRATATVSGNLTHSPKTGASSWVMAAGALVLFFAGTALAGTNALFVDKGSTPQEITQKRRHSHR